MNHSQGVGVAYPRMKYDLEAVDISRVADAKNWPKPPPTPAAVGALITAASSVTGLIYNIVSSSLSVATSPMRSRP